MEGTKDGIKLFVVIASGELSNHRKEEGNLHMDLGDVIAVKSAVEAGIF